MSSEKRIAASRANGALSRGPKTPEGKARSARNATRHGLLAQVVVLEEEPTPAFTSLCEAYVQRFGPIDEVEKGIVDEMVVTTWRLRRAWAIENRYFDTAVADQDGPSAADRLMSAFSTLTDAKRLDLLHRYETRLHMMFQRAFRNLQALRKLNPPPVAPQSPIPNEPKISFALNKSAGPEPSPNLNPALDMPADTGVQVEES